MVKLVFLVEEASMEAALFESLPRMLPGTVEGSDWQIVPRKGKSDLEKAVPKYMRNWREPSVKFVSVRDQDRGDCVDVKNRLLEMCRDNGRDDALVRIPCRMLEAWFIGDLEAVANAFNRHSIKSAGGRAKYRNPDSLGDPAGELRRLVPGYGKVGGARSIAPQMRLDDSNRSRSFHVFVNGVIAFRNRES